MPAEVADEVTGRRVIIACDRGRLRVVGCEVVLGRVGGSDPLDGRGGRRGLWYELRDGAGRPLWRRIVTGPAAARGEWRLAGRSAAVGAGSATPRTFEVVVPTVPGAVALAIVGPPAGDRERPAVDLAVLPLEHV